MQKKPSYTIADFSPHLFWDVDKENLEMEKSKKFIIPRVLEYGIINDWKIIQQYYGINEIVEIAKNVRTLDNRAWMFIASLANISPESFRCYTTKQSMPRHWIY